MGVGAGLYMYVVVVQKFTFAISSPDEFLSCSSDRPIVQYGGLDGRVHFNDGEFSSGLITRFHGRR